MEGPGVQLRTGERTRRGPRVKAKANNLKSIEGSGGGGDSECWNGAATCGAEDSTGESLR
eukprot:2934024-Rhodomonas_salina.1